MKIRRLYYFEEEDIEQFRKALKEKNMTIVELAKEMRISREMINQWITKGRPINYKKLFEIQEKLEWSFAISGEVEQFEKV